MTVSELPIPSAVTASTRSLELARIWISDEVPIVVISNQLWDDPAAWGLMMVYLTHHIASAYEEIGRDKEDTIQRIRAALEAGWAHPTS